MKFHCWFNIPLLCIICPLLIFPKNGQAELTDPTRPAFYTQDSGTIDTMTEDLKLSAIWISKSFRRATINGITVNQGETIFSNVKIIKIHSNAVKIEQNGISRNLKLLSRSIKTR